MFKSCPLCGNAIPLPTKISRDENWGYNFTLRLTCPKCKLTLERESAHDKQGWCCDRGEAMAALVEAWNCRVTVEEDAATHSPPPQP